jgi:hypothetical protein
VNENRNERMNENRNEKFFLIEKHLKSYSRSRLRFSFNIIPFRIMNSSITNSIALSPIIPEDSMIRNREGILPDYTRQGKSTLPSRWSTSGNIVQISKHLQMTDESNFGNSSIQVPLDYSSGLKDSIRAIILDGKSTDERRDRNEFIDFYLKIPSKELRLQRENSKERLKLSIHLNKKTAKKKGKSIIGRLLSDVVQPDGVRFLSNKRHPM